VNPETKAFLDQVRDAEGPSADTEQRVLRAVHATVALNAAASATASAAKSYKLSTVSTATVTKAGLMGLLFVGASMTLVPWNELEPVRTRQATARVSAPRREARSDATSIHEVESNRVSELEDASVRVSPQEPPPRPPADLNVRAQAARRSQRSELREELTLLGEVRAALQRGDGAYALRMLDGHVTADRQLRSERQAARVLALCAVGRKREAERAAEAFLRQYPSSPHRAAIAGSCAAGKKTD
jgi:RNA polymerase sigma-70 factor (ECF subfamily)